MKLIPPQEFSKYADVAVLRVRNRATVKSGHWHRDAWETIAMAIEDESVFMREAGPCAVLTYEKLVDLALEHLRFDAEAEHAWELLRMLEQDVEILGLFMTAQRHLTDSMNAREPFAQEEHDIIAQAVINLGALALEMEKELTDTS